VSRLISTGYARRLEPSDCFVNERLSITALDAEFQRDWAKQAALPKPSLWAAASTGCWPIIAFTARPPTSPLRLSKVS